MNESGFGSVQPGKITRHNLTSIHPVDTPSRSEGGANLWVNVPHYPIVDLARGSATERIRQSLS